MNKRRLTVFICAIFLIIATIVWFRLIPYAPDGSIDLVEVVEIGKYTEEELKTKLIGQYRVNINQAWGTPEISEMDTDIYQFADISYQIVLQYDSGGRVVNLKCKKIE